jgi:hypothetical protein
MSVKILVMLCRTGGWYEQADCLDQCMVSRMIRIRQVQASRRDQAGVNKKDLLTINSCLFNGSIELYTQTITPKPT